MLKVRQNLRKVAAIAACLAVTTMFVQAQTPVTINVSTLGGANANNSSNPTESQWNYDATNKRLTLLTANGNYTLSGTNSDMYVYVFVPGSNVNVTLNNINITTIVSAPVLFFNSQVTTTLIGNNTITAIGNSGAQLSGTNQTFNGNGSLTVNNKGFILGYDLVMSIEGNAVLTVNAISVDNGIQVSDGDIINIGANATLNATGKYYGIWGINNNFTLNCDGTAILKTTDTYGCGIRADNATVTITGSGSVSAEGNYQGIYLGSGVLVVEDCSVTAEGTLSNAINTSNNIKMNDAAKLTMKTVNGETHTFEKLNPASTYEWKLTNATTADPLTNAIISASVAAGATGTVERVNTSGAPIITTTSLPNGTVGTAYSKTLAATGNTPIAWSVSVGNLPAGLTLNATNGVISGNPTTAGTANFTVKASNGVSPDATQALSITIVAASGAPTITTTSLSNGTVGTAYSQTLMATGDTPISWSVSAGSLPSGLTLNGTSGEISGNPTKAGTANFTVKASNGTLPDATQALSITIVAALGAPTITTTSLPNGWVGTAYSQTLAASGNTPIAWSVADGFLPAGLALNPNTGEISGTPTSTGTSNFTVKASNGALPDAVKDFSITIYPAATVTGVTVSPATVSVQKGKTQQFTATVKGTNSPAQTVKWSISGQIDAGTAISSTGLLTVAAGETAASLTVTATSTMDNTKSGIATVTVINANTGMDAPQVDPLRAWTENGKLHLSGLTAGRQWSVYNIAGVLIHRAIAAGSEAETALPAHGIYIVRADGKQLKIDN